MARVTLNKHETTDAYEYLAAPRSVRVNVTVVNNDVLVGFGFGSQQAPYFPDNDEHLGPTTAGLARSCDLIRFKSATPGEPAFVSFAALTVEE